MFIFYFLILTGHVFLVSCTHQARDPVYFKEDGTFKIATFTDLHYGEHPESEIGPAQDASSSKVMRDILELEHPDLVVFTGDMLTADEMLNGSAYVDLFLSPVIEGNYKWASTYGNHDIGKNVTRAEVMEAEQKYALSYTHQGIDHPDADAGNTNYYVPIYPDKNTNTTQGPILILWFFDFRGGNNGTKIPAYVHETVVEWFRQEVDKVKKKWGNVSSLAFFHYPTDAYAQIWEELGSKTDPECPGQFVDAVTPQQKDSGFMTALVESDMILASFVGHNHGNGWCCSYKKRMDLCYNRQTGYGGWWRGWTRGSRIITLDKDSLIKRRLSSHVRLETGEVIDEYPVKSENDGARFEKISNFFHNVWNWMCQN